MSVSEVCPTCLGRGVVPTRDFALMFFRQLSTTSDPVDKNKWRDKMIEFFHSSEVADGVIKNLVRDGIVWESKPNKYRSLLP